MNRYEIIKLAREAGIDKFVDSYDMLPQLKRFAALVAAAEREACAVAATELRRLHAENEALRQALEAIVIGYGEPDIPEAALVKARAALARAGEKT